MTPTRLLSILGLVLAAHGCARFDARRSFLEGQRLEGEGQLDRAVEAYGVAAREDPSEEHQAAFRRTREALVVQHLRGAKAAELAGDFDRALGHWKQLQRYKPEDERIAARARIAELRVSGDSEELWEAAQALFALAPGNREVVRVVAELQARVIEDSLAEAWVSLRAGRAERAFAAFERVRKLDPRNPELERPDARRLISEVLEQRGDEAAASGDWEAARTAYLRAEIEQPRPELAEKRRRLELEAEHEAKLLTKARALRAKGRAEEAMVEYERLLPPRPESPLYRELQEVRAEVEANRRRSAESLLVRGDVEKALSELGADPAALKRVSPESKRRALEVLLEEARSASLAGEGGRSVGRLKRAMQLAEPPTGLAAVLQAAVTELEGGARLKAMASFAEARRLAPRSRLAAVGHEVARELELRAALAEGRELSGKDPDRAYRAYQAAAELSPGNPHVENALARLRPRVVRAAVQRALTLESEGQPGQAVFALRRALELAPDDQEAKDARARLVELLREPVTAAASLEILELAGAEGPCAAIASLLGGRLRLYLSKDRKLPFTIQEADAAAPLTLRSRVAACHIDEQGARLEVLTEFLAEAAAVTRVETRLELPPAPPGKGRDRALGRRDELVTQAAAALAKSLRAERDRMAQWPEVRARAAMQAGDVEAAARAYVRHDASGRARAGAPALLSELERWLEQRVR